MKVEARTAFAIVVATMGAALTFGVYRHGLLASPAAVTTHGHGRRAAAAAEHAAAAQPAGAAAAVAAAHGGDDSTPQSDSLDTIAAERARRIRRWRAKRPDCLVFLHLPKTAGRTTREALFVPLAKAIGKPLLSHYGGTANMRPENLEKYGLFTGHWAAGFVPAMLQGRNCATMTVLREPVSRVISAFYYHWHRGTDWPACLSAGPPLINDTECRLRVQYINDMTRLFAGEGFWDHYNTSRYAAVPVTASSLQRAKAGLAAVDFVCFADDLHPCLARVAAAFNVTLTTPAKSLAVNSIEGNTQRADWKRTNMANFTESTRRAIERANAFDMALYAWASKTLRDGAP